MRLTKNWIKIDNSIRPRKRNITKEPEPLNYSNQINDKGGPYLQKLLKTKEGYQTINSKYDSNSIINYNRNIQNIFSTDEKIQKATSYIMGSLITNKKDKFKQMSIPRNNFSSNKDLYSNNFSSEFNMIDNPKTKSLIEINKRDFSNNTTHINDEKCNTMIKTPKKEKENLKYSKNSIYSNKNAQNNFLNISKNNIKLNNSEFETAFKKSENMNKKYDKVMTLNRRQDFFKKLNVVNDEKRLRNENIFRDYKLVNNSQLVQTIPSPKRSTSIRQFSPFNDILSKSTNTFFINKIPINNNDNNNMNTLSVNHAYNNKSSFQSKKIIDKENISLNKNKNDIDRTMNNNYSNQWLLNLDNQNKNNNDINNDNNKLIYRNKQSINQKVYQSNSLKNDENRNKYRKKYLYISSRRKNDDENHKFKQKIDESDLKINEFSINEIYNEEKSKNFKINREDLKKYLNYFIKDIAPININQFVIYSHSNNNYKSEASTLKSDEAGKIISLKNKSSVELNKLQEERYINKRSNNIGNMNSSSSFIQDINHLTFKDNLLDMNNTSSLNKILVKKRPINENNISLHNISNLNDDFNKNNKKNYDNYTGFTICQKIKGETITNIPLNINNLEIINQYLKESGFEITQIKSNKLISKENTNSKMRKKNELTAKKEKEDTKGKLNKKKESTSNEIKKLSNNKDRNRTFASGFYEDFNKRKNASLKPRKNLKKTPTKMSETSRPSNMKSKKSIKKIKDDSKRGNILGKLNDKMEDSGNEKEKMTLREKLNKVDANKNIIMCSPNFSFDNNYKK